MFSVDTLPHCAASSQGSAARLSSPVSLSLVTKADEIVKARLAAEQASDAAQKERTGREEMEAWTQYLADAIPQLLALLEGCDYPDAVLLNVSTPAVRRPFRRQPRAVEMAAWVLDEDRWSEGHSSVHMLSDGRLVSSGWSSQSPWNSGPISVNEVSTKYSDEGARNLLQRAAKGVEQLITRYGAH